MSKYTPLTAQQIAQFKQDGVLVIRSFYSLERDIVPIQRGIYEVVGQVMQRHAVADQRGPFDPSSFDDGYQALIKQDRAFGGEVYDAVKQLPAFYRLVSHAAHDMLFKQLRPDSLPGVATGGYGIRIDNPQEDKFRAMWHQEYPAQLRSLDGLVFWSPLVAVTEALGPVQFCPGSQREGPLPVIVADPDRSGRSGAYALKLDNEKALLSRYEKIAPLSSPGDLVLIDFLVLHASGRNESTRSRWTLQLRYFNFADPTGRAHGWKGSFAAGVDFRSIHPELCASPGEEQD